MRIIKSVAVMQRLAMKWRAEGRRLCLVPTMGYLHEGHLSLCRLGRKTVGPKGIVLVSIYVNPAQFGPKEDFSRYPRDFKRDCAMCRTEAVDLIFAPNDRPMYPAGFSTFVVEESLSKPMEGKSRPTHFRGVTTVVAKLFNIIQPTFAVFGAKDFQQAALIKRMIRDLNFPVKLVVASTFREKDGLAMSSRNSYLSAEQRSQAPLLSRMIAQARKQVRNGSKSANRLKAELLKLAAQHSAARIDYVEFFDPRTLAPVEAVSRGTHLALAVFFGKTRLIDNGQL